MKFSGVMIGSDNPTTLGEFYTKLFGEAAMQDGEWYSFDVGGGSLTVGPHSEVHGQNDTPGRIMSMIESEDFQADCARVAELGATVVAKPYQPNNDEGHDMWLATYADPDGNYFQLSTPWK